MQKVTDVQISSAARQAGLIGPGATNAAVSVSLLRSFLRILGVPVDARSPFEAATPANLNLSPAGVGSGATMGGN